MPAPEQNNNPTTQKAHGPKMKAASSEVRRGSQSKAGAVAVVWGRFPAVGIMQAFCMYILAFRREEGHLHWWERRNSHSGMYDTCHTIMWLLSALESTGFTWVASPAFSSVSSSSPSPEERKQSKKGKKENPKLHCSGILPKRLIPLLQSRRSDNREHELRPSFMPGEHL